MYHLLPILRSYHFLRSLPLIHLLLLMAVSHVWLPSSLNVADWLLAIHHCFSNPQLHILLNSKLLISIPHKLMGFAKHAASNTMLYVKPDARFCFFTNVLHAWFVYHILPYSKCYQHYIGMCNASFHIEWPYQRDFQNHALVNVVLTCV
jgi:hypothetical protein